MTIKILEKTKGCFPIDLEQGDWYDLFTAEDIKLCAPQAHKLHKRNQKKEDVPEIRTRDVDFDFKLIPLGVAIEAPKGMECHLLPRSSTFKKYGLLQANSMGIIDNSYSSNKDEWKIPVVATRKITIPKGTRIAQFRVQLSQKATMWQKIKWLFSNKIRLVAVSSLDNPERGGFGSTGENQITYTQSKTTLKI